MFNIPIKSCGAVTRQTVMSINQKCIQPPMTSSNIQSLNNSKKSSTPPTQTHNNANSMPTNPYYVRNTNSSQLQVSEQPITSKPIPALQKPIQKGQKMPLSSNVALTSIQAKFGWNVSNSNCDVDVSAFLLNSNGKVLGDDWFVFYGQQKSPDESTIFSNDNGADREKICINFQKINTNISKIVFVLTINEALEKHLNFSMLKDAYIRIMDPSNTELVSFKMEDYYSNVTSMMIGEVYQHNGVWKFNAIGNGVARDLTGLCELYGVQVV